MLLEDTMIPDIKQILEFLPS